MKKTIPNKDTMKISISILTGKDTSEYIDYISQLRINIFKEYPYLYIGDITYEKQYMADYSSHNQAMIAIAKVDGIIAGISTGIPLISNSEIIQDIKEIFKVQKIDDKKYYYYGEIIILPEYRGLGLATRLYSTQDKLIKEWGFEHTCILTVQREENHPLKPINFESQEDIWKHLKFLKTGYKANFNWPTLQADGSTIDTPNTLELWAKKI